MFESPLYRDLVPELFTRSFSWTFNTERHLRYIIITEKFNCLSTRPSVLYILQTSNISVSWRCAEIRHLSETNSPKLPFIWSPDFVHIREPEEPLKWGWGAPEMGLCLYHTLWAPKMGLYLYHALPKNIKRLIVIIIYTFWRIAMKG